MIVRTPNSWLKQIYIAKRNAPTYDTDGNEVFTYATPKGYVLNHQPISSSTDIEMFGANASQIQKAYDLEYDFTDFDEFDKAYLDGVTPTGETVVGSKANYVIERVLLQNLATVIYFKKLSGLTNGRV